MTRGATGNRHLTHLTFPTEPKPTVGQPRRLSGRQRVLPSKTCRLSVKWRFCLSKTQSEPPDHHLRCSVHICLCSALIYLWHAQISLTMPISLSLCPNLSHFGSNRNSTNCTQQPAQSDLISTLARPMDNSSCDSLNNFNYFE